MRVQTLCFAGIAAALWAVPVSAHHSFAMFDAEKTITLNGTVKEMEWTNPHMWLNVMAPDASGKIVEYPLEMQGPGQSMKNGWKPDSVKPGDKVTVEMHPLKTGARGGQLMSVVLPSGQRLNVTGKAPSPFGE
ncbi:MAG TPA: DUF6152 family protein [Micropepsaceae bacterium]|jgi:hypothetical protein|nr:DUF6152 family protein [Micropepsaceae bacterium]